MSVTQPRFHAPAKVIARKEGRRCTVFVDNGYLVPFETFDNPPEHAFPQTMTEQELRAAFPHSEIVMIERERPPQEEAKDMLSPEEMDKRIAAIKGGATEAAAPAAPTTLKVVEEEGSLKSRLLRSFRELCVLAKGGSAEVEVTDAETIGTFLINALPELEEELKLASQATQPKKRFSL